MKRDIVSKRKIKEINSRLDNTINNVEDIDTCIIKGNRGFVHFMTKIAQWNKNSTNKPGVSSAFPSQLNYGVFGDSTGALAWDNIPSAHSNNVFPFEGVMAKLGKASARCTGQPPLTVTGDCWEADGTAGKLFDYSVHPAGLYRHLGNGATLRSSSTQYGTETCLYYIKEPGAGVFTFALRDNADAVPISVNGVEATISDISCDNALGAGKAGFCYMTILGVGATAGKFQLGFGNNWTADLLYNDSAANVQAALEALPSVGVGNVGVTKSGTTWTILIKSNNFGWQTIKWRNGSTVLTGYLTFGLAGQRHIKMTVTSGTVRTWNPYNINRHVNGVASYNLARGGLRLGDTIQWNQDIANSILGDMKLDFCSFAWTSGQAAQRTLTQVPFTATPYTVTDLRTYFNSFILKLETASPNTDWVYQSFPPSSSNPDDSIINEANPAAKEIVEAAGHVWIDTDAALITKVNGEVKKGWSLLTYLDGYSQPGDFVTGAAQNQWCGDGIHLGGSYHSFVGSLISKQIGLYDFMGILNWNRLNTDYGIIAGQGLDFSNGPGAQNAFRLMADQTFSSDAVLQLLNSNRCVVIKDSAGNVCVQLGTINDHSNGLGSYFAYPLHFGTYNGPQIKGGSGSPEGVVTAEQGSIFLRKDGAGNTSIYIKESGGISNTGWVPK